MADGMPDYRSILKKYMGRVYSDDYVVAIRCAVEDLGEFVSDAEADELAEILSEVEAEEGNLVVGSPRMAYRHRAARSR
jgi:hypothetical protein